MSQWFDSSQSRSMMTNLLNLLLLKKWPSFRDLCVRSAIVTNRDSAKKKNREIILKFDDTKSSAKFLYFLHSLGVKARKLTLQKGI